MNAMMADCNREKVSGCWLLQCDDCWLLQAYRNSVPVPRHWSQKRKYLQGKRGIEKPPFVLPDFIEATGIGQMRQAYQVHCLVNCMVGGRPTDGALSC